MASRPLEEAPDGIRIFVDTNVLSYHLLDDDLYGASCRDFLQRVAAQSVTVFTKPWALACQCHAVLTAVDETPGVRQGMAFSGPCALMKP